MTNNMQGQRQNVRMELLKTCVCGLDTLRVLQLPEQESKGYIVCDEDKNFIQARTAVTIDIQKRLCMCLFLYKFPRTCIEIGTLYTPILSLIEIMKINTISSLT